MSPKAQSFNFGSRRLVVVELQPENCDIKRNRNERRNGSRTDKIFLGNMFVFKVQRVIICLESRNRTKQNVTNKIINYVVAKFLNFLLQKKEEKKIS